LFDDAQKFETQFDFHHISLPFGFMDPARIRTQVTRVLPPKTCPILNHATGSTKHSGGKGMAQFAGSESRPGLEVVSRNREFLLVVCSFVGLSGLHRSRAACAGKPKQY
jgi:hypothetical protein